MGGVAARAKRVEIDEAVLEFPEPGTWHPRVGDADGVNLVAAAGGRGRRAGERVPVKGVPVDARAVVAGGGEVHDAGREGGGRGEGVFESLTVPGWRVGA